MKKITLYTGLLLLLWVMAMQQGRAQVHQQQPTLGTGVPWSRTDLISADELAGRLEKPVKNRPVILNIGVMENIKGAYLIGPLSKPENKSKLDTYLKQVPTATEIVIYCGYCPFAKCPNIRPAYMAMKALGYTNIRVLDLLDNLHKNWITKGYPMSK